MVSDILNSKSVVILSVAKDLVSLKQILRYAQNDKSKKYEILLAAFKDFQVDKDELAALDQKPLAKPASLELVGVHQLASFEFEATFALTASDPMASDLAAFDRQVPAEAPFLVTYLEALDLAYPFLVGFGQAFHLAAAAYLAAGYLACQASFAQVTYFEASLEHLVVDQAFARAFAAFVPALASPQALIRLRPAYQAYSLTQFLTCHLHQQFSYQHQPSRHVLFYAHVGRPHGEL
jgi:hypothetical protein